MKPIWSNGLRMAVILFVAILLLAASSYVFGCIVFSSRDCAADRGLDWILGHPVYPAVIPIAVIYGFVVGAFRGAIAAIFSAVIPGAVRQWLVRRKGVIAWVFVIGLIAAFAIWGLPEMFAVLNSQS